jgi:hypothetical protein
MKLYLFLSGSFLFLLFTGCSSIIDAHKQKEPYMTLYYGGKVKDAANQLLEKAEDRRDTGDEVMWCLEAGSAMLTDSQYKKSLAALNRAEDLIKEYDNRATVSARDAGAETGSAMTNPNALPYKGMYLDRIMLNAYKSFDYMGLNDFVGAMVEIRRMRDTQRDVEKKFQDEIDKAQKEIDTYNRKNRQQASSIGVRKDTTVSFDQILKTKEVKEAYEASAKKSNKLYASFVNPFATYLSAIGYLLDNNYSEAMVDFRNLYKMDAGNPLIQRDYVTCARMLGDKIPAELSKIKPYSYPLSSKVVYVIFMNGRGPSLKQVKFQIILPYVGYTGIAFPVYEYHKPVFKGITMKYCWKGSKQSVNTVRVADIDAVASREYHERLPSMITRLVISTLTKELASYVAVQAARTQGTGYELGAYAVTGIYKYLFNTADTRCWETLPGEVQAAHLPIPDDGVICLSPSLAPISVKVDSGKQKKPQEKPLKIKGDVKIRLKKNTRFAILYVRGLPGNFIVKVFEFK